MHTHIGTENYDFNPNWVSPPGETIEYLLEYYSMTVKDLANYLNLTVSDVEALIKGDLEINKTTASNLADAFNTPTEFWIKRESHYRKGLELGLLYE